MILITKDERNAIIKQFPDLHIARTVNHYYMEEARGAMRLLMELRGTPLPSERKGRKPYKKGN